MQRFGILLAACAFLSAAARAEEKPDEAISFRKDVAPILLKNCVGCHGPKEAQGGYRVDNFNLLMKAGESGEASVTPAKLDASELFARITSDDESVRMPLEGKPLPPEQIAKILRWIGEGAKYDGEDASLDLAAIVPRAPQPDAPKVYRAALPVTALAFSADGKSLFASGYHEVTVWNVAAGTLERRIGNVDQRVYEIALSPDGALLAVAAGTPGVSGEVKLFDPSTGALRYELARMNDSALGVAFSGDGRKLASCGADKSARIFDVATGAQERLIEEHADWVCDVAWSGDGASLITASRDKTAKIFDAATGAPRATYSKHGEQVFAVAFAEDGKSAFSAGADKQIHAWKADTAATIGKLEPLEGAALQLVQRDSRFFALLERGQAFRFAGALRKRETEYKSNSEYACSLAVSASGDWVAIGGLDGTVVIWDSESGKVIAQFLAAPGAVRGPAP